MKRLATAVASGLFCFPKAFVVFLMKHERVVGNCGQNHFYLTLFKYINFIANSHC